MWIAMNDSFVSIVEERNDKDVLVVRARMREDLEALFPMMKEYIIESEDSDYSFRIFLPKKYVAGVISDRVVGINYDNFKNSVRQEWRYTAYTKIWAIMLQVQERLPWWVSYRNL